MTSSGGDPTALWRAPLPDAGAGRAPDPRSARAAFGHVEQELGPPVTRTTADSRLVVAILLLTALVSGCGDTHADGDTHQSAAQKHFACHETERDRCYPPDILPAYCEVQAAREFFEEGKAPTSLRAPRDRAHSTGLAGRPT